MTSRTYDADFREATETVAVGAASSTVTNDYDLDGLLKTKGLNSKTLS